ncbi:hypothetical protein JCM19992_10170 [Thermostilla marina]
MSIVDRPTAHVDVSVVNRTAGVQRGKSLHRLAKVRELQGVSIRTMSRRMGVDARTVRREEDPENDIPLSVLYRWQKALGVPLIELLEETDEPLSAPVLKRARMVRLMKTAMAILEQSRQPGVQRLAQNLVQQLVEMMPELEGVGPWHSVGQRRSQKELGRAALRRFSMNGR